MRTKIKSILILKHQILYIFKFLKFKNHSYDFKPNKHNHLLIIFDDIHLSNLTLSTDLLQIPYKKIGCLIQYNTNCF